MIRSGDYHPPGVIFACQRDRRLNQHTLCSMVVKMPQENEHFISILLMHSLFTVLAVIFGIASTANGWQKTPSDTLNTVLADHDNERAVVLLKEILDRSPNDPSGWYNLACVACRLDQFDEAASALLRSVKCGFNDFRQMETDPDLESLHDHELFLVILERAEQQEQKRSRSAFDLWRATYGDEHYRYELDESGKLAYATALDEVSHRQMKRMLQQEADHLTATLFHESLDNFVLIAVPTPEDAKFFFGSDENVGGIYQHAERRLVARDIGGSLRHEFVHALHYDHMERLGLTEPHRLWVQEGLATLYEDYEFNDYGGIHFLPNTRFNIVKNRARLSRLVPLKQLMNLSNKQFMARSGALYPQVRSIFRFLAERNELADWYSSYVDTFQQDPSGELAFRKACGADLEEIEKEWKSWIDQQPRFDDRIDPEDAALGIVSQNQSVNNGVSITQVLAGSAASRARLRSGDVIVAVDDHPTRNLTELRMIIAAKHVGDTVQIRFRRKERYQTVSAILRKRGWLYEIGP